MPHPLQIAVLLSGTGRTLQNLIDEKSAGRLEINIRLVIGSRPGLYGIERARMAGLNTQIVDRRDFTDALAASERIFESCDETKVDLVCLAGWLSLLHIPPRYAGRVLNIHPSLLPQFGGKGMYGHKVHQAVLAAGCRTTGCTVHFVDELYDNGPVILQRTCPVLEHDTADTLGARLFEEEKIAYPEAIRMIQDGRVKLPLAASRGE